jgi:phosphoribosylformylglycinamidine cyclo-ligase
MSLTYKSAGVDIDAADQLIDRIKPFAARTAIPEVIGEIGAFAALCRVPSELREPIMVSSTDGVGTKLKVAFLADKHDTVGIDLVAMGVNDVITTGARPLFFLDYFATGTLDVERAVRVIEGIAAGCAQALCALIGGETAEMPDLYAAGEYDLAGFAVGVVERSAMVTGQAIRAGDVVLGVASNGLHSNGYSLARKVLLEKAALPLAGIPAGLGEPLVDALLRPTRIYVKAVQTALATGAVRGLCHITGGGLPGNIPRILPPGLGVELELRQWRRPPIFDLIAELGGVQEREMRRTFNLGLGFIVIAARGAEARVIEALRQSGEDAMRVGAVVDMPEAVDEARVRFI